MMIYMNIAPKCAFWCLNISFDTIHDLYRPYRTIKNFDENGQKLRFLAVFEKNRKIGKNQKFSILSDFCKKMMVNIKKCQKCAF